MLRLGMLLGFAYLGFLVAWFWSRRFRSKGAAAAAALSG
jgi:hypothetical protein